MRLFSSLSAVVASLVLAPFTNAICEDDIPAVTFNSLVTSFAMQVKSSNPALHGRFVSFTSSGVYDQTLYLSPVGTKIHNFTMTTGLWRYGTMIKAVVSTQWESDGTTRIFFTDRTQQNAVFGARLTCNEKIDDVQTEFHLVDGASVCIRQESGKRQMVRYKPAGACARKCEEVTLVAVCDGPPPCV
ncbi:hypothetical protein BDZ91DRAFT_721458 [Kalaharituber pfeilii]|nr:hypothetical protein BDZ91DRAFT_721458 [Kalaharituber pfeilii]